MAGVALPPPPAKEVMGVVEVVEVVGVAGAAVVEDATLWPAPRAAAEAEAGEAPIGAAAKVEAADEAAVATAGARCDDAAAGRRLRPLRRAASVTVRETVTHENNNNLNRWPNPKCTHNPNFNLK